jgi:hypothetical protein
MNRPSLYRRIKRGLSVAARAIITAPLKLPAKVVAAARYVALLVGVLDALDSEQQRSDGPDAPEGRPGE